MHIKPNFEVYFFPFFLIMTISFEIKIKFPHTVRFITKTFLVIKVESNSEKIE